MTGGGECTGVGFISAGSAEIKAGLGVVPGICPYAVGVRIRPKWPLFPPPSVDCTDWSLAFNSVCRVNIVAMVGSP
eukprot:7320341-Ditylum_brightwellii.AAC.1